MKASDLKPGQFFSRNKERRLCVWQHDGEVGYVLRNSRTVHQMAGRLEVTPLNVTGWDEPQSEQPRFDSWDKPTDGQILDACMSFNHGYGLLSEARKDHLRFEAKEWLHAWRKVFMEPSYIQRQAASKTLQLVSTDKDGCTLKHTPAPLQLREGGCYQRRDGEFVGPARPSASKVFPWIVGDGGYTDDGRYNEASIESAMDLIAEVPPPEPTPEFKPGDWVVWCDVDHTAEYVGLKTGEAYEIRKILDGGGVELVGAEKGSWHHPYRFRRATPAEVIAHKQANAQPDADGWIPHAGNSRPVDETQEVEYVLGNNFKAIGKADAGRLDWTSCNMSWCITHYRLVPSPQPIINWVEVVTL